MQLSSRPTSLSAPASPAAQSLMEQLNGPESKIHATLIEEVELPRQASAPHMSQDRQERWQGLGVFCSTFVTIFLAELGDKTQVTTLLMSAESQSPWMVFAGAGLALITTSLLGVLVGRWLANRLSPKSLETAAGAALLLVSVSLLWDVVHF
ncbi:TMEM165/GDT1 family protein [Trichocoleus desertorum]|uniref:TMEM165/GDT1 family protein n=1 Tax=Trichocoleus desertorum TaxID=1481672 RepID=UPI00329A68B9